MNGGRKDFFLNWHIFFSNFATRQLDPGMVILLISQFIFLIFKRCPKLKIVTICENKSKWEIVYEHDQLQSSK